MSSILSTLGLLSRLGLGAVAGVVLHELTHYLVARALGRRPGLTESVETVWSAPEIELRDRIAAAAPLVVGILLFPVLLLGAPISLWFFWGFYALRTSRKDLELAAGRRTEPA